MRRRFSDILSIFISLYFAAATVDGAVSKKIKEPRTGIVFDSKVQNLSLEKLGVRTKGPLKVYAVGQYGKSSSHNNKPNNAFVLKMYMSISREKMSSALMDALKPRCKTFGCDANQDTEFQDMVLQALPSEGAKSGTVLTFTTFGNKVALTVNGKAAGKVSGKAIAKAFAAIYTDSKAVCTMNPIVEKDESESFDRDKNVPGIVTAILAFLFALYTTYNPYRNKSGNLVISELNIYPIKSCAEQSVDSAVVTPRGFKGDRIAMVVDSDKVCCTTRDTDKVKLFHVQPQINFPDCSTMTLSYKGEQSPLTVKLESIDTTLVACSHNEAPGKLMLSDLGNTAASWIANATGIQGSRLVSTDNEEYDRICLINPGQGDPIPTSNSKAPVSLSDEAPFLLTNQASLDDLNERLLKRGHLPIDMRRFRPNLVVDAFQPWIEDTWKKIRIGGKVEFFVWQRCGRCIMTTIDRDSLTRAPKGEPLSTLNTFREGAKGQRNFGMHLIPDVATLRDDDEANWTVHVGDTIQVLEYDMDRMKEWESKFEN
ncbi:MOSC domain containing protein [Nitzschia inconspicua]|uniref:MOSC domain containing protein n=1 Tax=Nitzschia inconspicua TaxID=303405 RepID=A0A9K3PTU9_9STRA|nr:MOSC domain containing protein [Nitzschia inconspicua]